MRSVQAAAPPPGPAARPGALPRSGGAPSARRPSALPPGVPKPRCAHTLRHGDRDGGSSVPCDLLLSASRAKPATAEESQPRGSIKPNSGAAGAAGAGSGHGRGGQGRDAGADSPRASATPVTGGPAQRDGIHLWPP